MRTAQGRGFTLIEMLVVMAIIGILAGMLFPTFARARDAARKISCLSRVKQLTTAVLMYSADNDDRFPPSAYMPPSGSHIPVPPDSPIWPAYIAEYVGNHDVFICPDCGDESYYADTWEERGVLSIGLNQNLEDRHVNVPYCPSYFNEPVRTIMLADSTPPSEDVPFEKARGFQVQPDREPNTQAAVGCRHFRGTNIGFVDGHAGWFISERIWQLHNPAELLWTPWQQTEG
jgi:prepilin-type N-terminal cleavage/methylation domain-containing protein/prepilin-type processing-associated H-X9-DG protein